MWNDLNTKINFMSSCLWKVFPCMKPVCKQQERWLFNPMPKFQRKITNHTSNTQPIQRTKYIFRNWHWWSTCLWITWQRLYNKCLKYAQRGKNWRLNEIMKTIHEHNEYQQTKIWQNTVTGLQNSLTGFNNRLKRNIQQIWIQSFWIIKSEKQKQNE